MINLISQNQAEITIKDTKILTTKKEPVPSNDAPELVLSPSRSSKKLVSTFKPEPLKSSLPPKPLKKKAQKMYWDNKKNTIIISEITCPTEKDDTNERSKITRETGEFGFKPKLAQSQSLGENTGKYEIGLNSSSKNNLLKRN